MSGRRQAQTLARPLVSGREQAQTLASGRKVFVLFLFFAVLLAGSLAAVARGSDLAPRTRCPSSPKRELLEVRHELLCLHNYARARHHLRALRLDAGLTRAASKKVNAMLESGDIVHDPLGLAWWVWFPPSFGWEAENIAGGYESAREVFAAWLHSPEHRANILARQARAIGYASGRKPATGRVWAVDFGG